MSPSPAAPAAAPPAMRRVVRFRRLAQALAAVALAVVERGHWLSGEDEVIDRRTGELLVGTPLDPTHAEKLRDWGGGLEECGEVGMLEACPSGKTRQVTFCCRQKPCPRHQRRRSQEQIRKSRDVFLEHRNTRDLSWKVVTLNPPTSGDQRKDAQLCARARRLFFRLASREGKWKAKGGWGSIETSGNGNVHLHILVYSGYIEREACRACRGTEREPVCGTGRWKNCKGNLLQWWRSMTCEREGCKHAARDPECEGAVICDVRRVRPKPGKDGRKPDELGALREVLKYAAKPALRAVRRDGSLAVDEREHFEDVLRFYLATRGMRLMQPYGIALAKRGDDADDVDPDEAVSRRICSCCGKLFRPVCGWSSSGMDVRTIPWEAARRRLWPPGGDS